MKSLPPLNAVRAFEAAGRHLSLSRAAVELNVTHGAVSRQIARLESHLGVRLFVRTVSGLVLTERGRLYLDDVVVAMDRLRTGTGRIAHAQTDAVVRLSVPPTFAMRWLIPRLAGFSAAHRGVALDVTTAMETPDFTSGGYDAAIRRMRRVPQHLAGQAFLSARTIAVCSPHYAESLGLRRIADLPRATLIATGTEPTEWERWFRSHRVAARPSIRTLQFEQLYFALQAAGASLGVALAPETLVADDLASGRLVAPFAARPVGDRSYTIVHPPDSPKRVALQLLVQWLVTLAREQATSRGG